MSNTYEILDSESKVVNTVIADEDFMLSSYPKGNYQKVVIQEPPIVTPKLITRLAFLNRFTDAEAITIDLASQGSTVEAATIRRYLSKVNAASFIDLSSSDIRLSVEALETQGFIGAGRALEILDTPVTKEETWA